MEYGCTEECEFLTEQEVAALMNAENDPTWTSNYKYEYKCWQNSNAQVPPDAIAGASNLNFNFISYLILATATLL